MGRDVTDHAARRFDVPHRVPAALATDEAFLAEYEKAVRTRPIFVQGADGERIIAGIKDVDPKIVAFLKSFVAEKTR